MLAIADILWHPAFPPEIKLTDPSALFGAPRSNPRPVRLVGVGHVALDHVFEVDALPVSPTKMSAHHYRRWVGGMTANAVVAAARLGASASLVAPVGDDEALSIFRAHLQSEGVQTQGLRLVPGAHPSVSVILVDAAGERTIVSRRSDAGLKAGALDLTCLDDADVLLTDPRFVDWAHTALIAARARGLLSILDADVAPPEDLRRLVGLAQWAVFSEHGLRAYMNADAKASDRSQDQLDRIQQGLGQALSAGAQVAVVTLGPQGLMWQRQGGLVHSIPAYPVHPVVDTTAAGDVFHGALGVALASGLSDDEALHWAAKAAALKCAHPGGVLGAPTHDEMKEA